DRSRGRAGHRGSTRAGGTAGRLRHRPFALPALALRDRRRDGLGVPRRRRGRRPGARLRAQAQLVRPGRRHRALRPHAAAAVLAPRGALGGAHQRQGLELLRRRQHPDAGPVEPLLEGELLQVHQRDAQRHRGHDRALGADLGGRAQRHRRRRWLRAGAGLRDDPAGQRPLQRRRAARGAAARRAARHRRAHPHHRQAPRPQGPRRHLRHQVRGLPGPEGRRVEARRRDRLAQAVGRHRARARGRGGGGVVAADRSHGHRAAAAAARGHRGRHPLPERPLRDRSRRPHRDRHRAGPRGRDGARVARAHPRPRRRLLAAGDDPRARRPDPAAAHQRARDRHLAGQDAGVGGGRAGLRARHRRALRVRLAGQRDPPLLQADAQAPRRHQPQPHRADRARQLLRRRPARARAGLRPAVHARGHVRGRRRGAGPGAARAHGVQLRRVPDGQRPDPTAVPVLGRRRDARRAGAGHVPDRRAGRGGGPGHRRPRRHRLRGRDPHPARGAGLAEPRRPDRHGGEPPVRRPGDHGDTDLRPAHGVAELDLPAAQRLGRRGRAAPLRHGTQGRLRPEAGV
ncbi:MAG: Benzoyl-CoA-dihydrodiol lyase, partial [uncultured Actinomycetospora sp.]